MIVDFIKSGQGMSSISLAKRQEDQLSSLTQSKVQDTSLTQEYYQEFASRNYETSDHFLNFVKSIFKTENFLKFFKYYRHPSPSSKLIQNKIKPNLKRVFHSEDSYVKYLVSGVNNSDFISKLDTEHFNEMVFDALLFRHNSILITDLDDINSPYRYLINIGDVKAIDYDYPKDVINKIAFKASIIRDGEVVYGYVYVDNQRYSFVNNNLEIVIPEVPHDLGRCPAHFIVREPFSDKPIVKRFIFSNIREEMEEYVFLKTLQKMTEPNGAIPIVLKLDAKVANKDADTGGPDADPSTDNSMSSQKAGKHKTVTGKAGIMQAGTTINLPQVRKADGSIDMDVVQKFLKHIYIPVEILEFIDKRVKEIRDSIISTILGDLVVSTEYAKNKEQIAKSVSVLEDNLRIVSRALSRIRTRADKDFLGLMYGPERVGEVSIFYGSDFFLEDQSDLYHLLNNSPNQIERKQTLIRLSQNRYKDNPEKAQRDEILYNIIPFCSDKDFDAIRDKIDPSTTLFQLQVRFDYWISAFEAEYGDILTFYNDQGDIPASQKYNLINELLTILIESNESNKIKIVQRKETLV